MPDQAISRISSSRGRQIATYVAATPGRSLPPEVVDAAKKALVDYTGVAIGSAHEPVTTAVRRVAESWNSAGNAQIFLAGRSTPGLAAFVNSTMAHAMDYDDVHPGGAGHPSGPCWSTALAFAGHYGYDEKTALAAFVTGFEIMARLA
jgi:2-methylcitrate dehydratase PrpD